MNREVRLTVNGRARDGTVEPRMSLADCLRDDAGPHRHACGLRARGVRRLHRAARRRAGARLPHARRAGAGARITTVEGLGRRGRRRPDRGPSPLQQAFQDKHGLQCGYCTPGILLTTHAFLRDNPHPTPEEIREMLAGNLCRCTGYHFIVEAVEAAARAVAKDNPA